MATTQTTAEADAAAPLPAPFTATFNFEDDEMCSSGIDAALEDLPEALRTELDAEFRGLTDWDAHMRLTARADALEKTRATLEDDAATEAEDLVDELKRAAAALTWCEHSCCCASDAWDGWGEEYLNSALSDLGDRVWAVQERSGVWYATNDIDDTLTVETLLRTNRPRSWSKAEIEWDGTALEASFTGDQGYLYLKLTPLTAAQVALWTAWQEADGDYSDVASRVLEADPAALTRTAQLWSKVDTADDAPNPDEVFGTFADLLTAVTAVGPEAADINVEILTRLAPSWTANLTDLLRVSLDVAAPAGAHVTTTAA